MHAFSFACESIAAARKTLPSWLEMKTPRFSVREFLLLMTICALLMPHIYSHAFTTNRLDLSWQTISELILEVEPTVSIHTGNDGNEYVEMTCIVPAENSEAFFPKLQVAVKQQINDSGWHPSRSEVSASNGLLTGFRYDLENESSRCSVVGRLLVRKNCEFNKDLDEVRFIILSPRFR